jgi:hypothetical protein
LRYILGISLKGLRLSQKVSVKKSALRAEIRTGNLPNMKQKFYPLDSVIY